MNLVPTPAATIFWRYLLSFLLFFTPVSIYGQNDDCSNAISVAIPNSGFAIGTFASSTNDLSAATIQAGESFAPALFAIGQTQKSLWYKFTIPTTRSVRVTLAQPGSAITAGDAGFAVYKINTCLPIVGDISNKLTPLGVFGNTFHPCVEPGDYLVQVCGKTTANGPVYITIELAAPVAAYDQQAQAYSFGTIGVGVRTITYAVDCQSTEDAGEVCTALGNYPQYNKSTWHVFTTPAYFDYIAFLLSHQTAVANQKFGYKLYKGDVRTNNYSTLPIVDGCDTLMTNTYYSGRQIYKCDDLETNTTYSIQLLFHQNFYDNVRATLITNGVAPTQAPEPIQSAIPAPSNAMGILPSTAAGVLTTKSDYHGCNSRHLLHPCPPSVTANGLLYGGLRYNLSSFFTFTLSSTSNVTISANPFSGYCGPAMLVRLYQQNVSNNCATLDTLNIVSQFMSNSVVNCLPPGNYTLQVMGRDSAVSVNTYSYSSFSGNNNTPVCILSNLGQRFQLNITVRTINAVNSFSLINSGAFNGLNTVAGNMQPLVNGTNYTGIIDTFGCGNTILPWDTACTPSNSKAIYREFIVPDSGIVSVTNTTSHWFKLYKGDASALATAQGISTYPSEITGLIPHTQCLYSNECDGRKVCVLPGAYSLVSFGDAAAIGQTSNMQVRYNVINTTYDNPANAYNMGTLNPGVNTLVSTVDYFGCKDNAVPINGYQPCTLYGQPATKAIYRQFYLSAAATINISGSHGTPCGVGTIGSITLFKGKATDGLAGLTVMNAPFRCFSFVNTVNTCTSLDSGWYTLVSYGNGPSYENPFQNINQGYYGSTVGKTSQITVSATVACAGPKYNRPYKAAVDINTGNPFLVQWGPRTGHTNAYPKTDTIYQLPRESFNCTVDTPFSAHPIPTCNATLTKVAYYVFRTTQESYVQIDAKGYWAAVYSGDARTDSASFGISTLINPCNTQNGYIQLCRLQPGNYTLVIFATSAQNCHFVEPTLYIDRVGYSRFDHAASAYDFGLVPTDSAYHFGKVGDVNPIDATRAPSDDIFYCTTGSRQTDPAQAACSSTFNSQIYSGGDNIAIYNSTTNATSNPWIIPRRNLWYSFVVDKGGYVKVRVVNRTIGKGYQHPFAVYKSNVDGTIPWTTVVSSGQVDSTVAQGLTFIGQNANYSALYCWQRYNEFTFYRDPCSPVPERYYIVVDNSNSFPYEYPGMKPNSQIEVGILVDSVNAILPLFDHYSQASSIGTNLVTGTYNGATDNYSCATRDATDPLYNTPTCTKTLWYKFTSNVTGHVRYRIRINNAAFQYSPNYIQLFKQFISGDSTAAGLNYQPGTTFYDNLTGTYWSQNCITPGTYYFILPGCSMVNEYVYPIVQIIEEGGDFCSAPVMANLGGAGTNVSSLIVDCHTIGTDYGEFNPTLSCPPGAVTANYKTSWFRINVTGTDTLDVTTFLTESTNALSSDIKYRMMDGNCGAMQERSCVQDALTQDTYKCLAPGSYYVQVFTPIIKNGVPVTGTISLNLSAVVHADTCAPIPPCLVNASFIPQFSCVTNQATFTNYSTFGSAVQYNWDLGHDGQTSTAVSPVFTYPALSVNQNYTVTLTVRNNGCSPAGQSTFTSLITVPGRPNFSLGNDTTICTPGSLLQLNATSWTGSTYQWNNGSTAATINATAATGTYWAAVTYNGCTKRDTIRVNINPITRIFQTRYLCGNDSVLLNSSRGYGEIHSWSTGVTTASVYAKLPGIYINTITWNGCVIRDTFNIIGAAEPFSRTDTTICYPFGSFILNAATPGAINYLWQNNSTASIFNVTMPGTYSVRIWNGTCYKRDTIIVFVSPQAVTESLAAFVCEGQSYTLPWNIIVNATGTYRDTLRNMAGCDSIRRIVNLWVQTPLLLLTTPVICEGDSYTLPWGDVVTSGGIYRDTIHSALGCDSVRREVYLSVQSPTEQILNPVICRGASYILPWGIAVNVAGVYRDTLRSLSGCDSIRRVVNLTIKEVTDIVVSTSVCDGQTYTLPWGTVATATGIYRDTLHYTTGCDSVRRVVNLTVQPWTTQLTNAIICEGQSYTLPWGAIVSVAGIYRDTLHYTTGCDSVRREVNLTVQQATTQATNPIICDGQNYTLPWGTVVTTTGIYRDTLHYTTGCDSVRRIVNLTVQTWTTQTTNPIICDGQSYTLPWGTIVTTTGIYRDTLHYTTGCDSVRREVNLIVQTATTQTTNPIICDGQSYTLPWGTVVSVQGIYRDTLHYTTGCDSVRREVNLTVQTWTTQTSNPVICDGQTYTLPWGTVVTTTGIYRDTLHYTTGCDSVRRIVNLTVQTWTTQTTNPVICQGASYTLPWGITVTTTGIYRDTLHYATGCDSVRRVVNLTVQQWITQVTNPVICAGQTYTLPWGTIVSTAGVYRDTLYYTTGCDSVRREVNLTVQQATTQTTNPIICDGQSYTLPWGTVVTTTGIYRDTLHYTTGCDSVRRIVNLTVQTWTTQTTNPVICQGASYTLPWGIIVNTAGVYRDTLHYTTGCDSIRRVVNLQVTAAAVSIINATICSDEIYTLPWGAVINTAGTYKDTVRTALGCDSLIRTVHLRVDPAPVVAINYNYDYVNCMSGTARLEASGGVRYTWTPASSLSNATIYNPVASPSATTWYKVIVTSDKGCTTEDSVQIKVITGNPDYGYLVPNAFTPNGDGRNDCFGVPTWGAVTEFEFSIYSRWGERIFYTRDPRQCWDGRYKGAEQSSNVFVYQITANGLCGKIYRKGTFTLVR